MACGKDWTRCSRSLREQIRRKQAQVHQSRPLILHRLKEHQTLQPAHRRLMIKGRNRHLQKRLRKYNNKNNLKHHKVNKENKTEWPQPPSDRINLFMLCRGAEVTLYQLRIRLAFTDRQKSCFNTISVHLNISKWSSNFWTIYPEPFDSGSYLILFLLILLVSIHSFSVIYSEVASEGLLDVVKDSLSILHTVDVVNEALVGVDLNDL